MATVVDLDTMPFTPGKGHATCPLCEQEMKPGVACIEHAYSATEDGPRSKALPYDGQWTGRICHDCNAPEGGFHHMGCDVERCPVCGLQLLGCEHADFIHFEQEVAP